MKPRKIQRKRQRGIASLEFLLVAPVLMLVMFAVSELGWAFHQYQTMTRASRDGARYVASNAMVGSIGLIYLKDSVIQQASNLVVYGNPAGTGEPVLPGWSTADVTVTSPDSAHVSVTARYDYTPLLGRLPAFYGGESMSLSFEMHSTVQMRAL